MSVEFAIEYDDGTVGLPSSEAFCRITVQAQRTDKASWSPRAVRVLRREVGEWQPVEDRSRAS